MLKFKRLYYLSNFDRTVLWSRFGREFVYGPFLEMKLVLASSSGRMLPFGRGRNFRSAWVWLAGDLAKVSPRWGRRRISREPVPDAGEGYDGWQRDTRPNAVSLLDQPSGSRSRPIMPQDACRSMPSDPTRAELR